MQKASVIIPAYNEGKVIDRCLRALAGVDLRVVVVANGCTDDTVARAEVHPGVEVIDIAVASKIAALNAGDLACGDLFPRIYLDADIELRSDDAQALAEFLAAEHLPAVGAPVAAFDLAGRPWLIRSFYRAYARLPYLTAAMVGSGCYAVNSAGRARWGEFPDMIADDLFVQGLFELDERRIVEGTSFVISAPRTVRGLLRIRTRTYRGNRQAATLFTAGTMSGSRGGSLRAALDVCRHEPGLTVAMIVYLTLNFIATIRARRAHVGGWLTDSSSRE